ncbi:MAG: arylsulfotransferase family protein [Solirubrobacteraceae bacterium]
MQVNVGLGSVRVVFLPLVGLLSALGLATGPKAAATPVAVFPTPGSQVVSPQAQVAFRGLPIAALGAISVAGSQSGVHPGRLFADSDGQGASFRAVKSFRPGEKVTVTTSLDVIGAKGGKFQYTIARPAGAVPVLPLTPAPRVGADIERFRSRPDLEPPSVRVLKGLATRTGDIFIAPQQGPIQTGPMIFDSSGSLVWFKSLPKPDIATDFRVQQYQGQPVLTWWQGYPGAGSGVGEDVIDNTAYQQIATVHAANGLSADLHEFELTPQGTALITAYFPVWWSLSTGPGPARPQIVFDSVAQEIDIPTGLVLFQWDSLDHVGLGDSYAPAPPEATAPFDYFHINDVGEDSDGSLVISARNTWAAYKVLHRSAQVIWRLGGKHSTFKLGPGASFAFQHDVRIRAANDQYVSLFDDGAGPPTVHSQSRGIELYLDTKHKTARLVAQREHGPGLLAWFEGNEQLLPNGDAFLGWGQQPYATEFDGHGRTVFDVRFVGNNSSYRAYRFPWVTMPHTDPALAYSGGPAPAVYASWNGATQVAGWRVLAGQNTHSLFTVATARRSGFETVVRLARAEPLVEAQALDASGRVLGVSKVLRGS